jgi:signal transduction histidine kinase
MNSNQSDTQPGNILIVDDTPENLQVLSTALSGLGYTVRGVIKGAMALRVARTADPDLILLDIIMPDMDGYQVCEQLKAEAKTHDIPIIFISGLNDLFDKIKAFKLGGVDYITKPFQLEEVLARIENQMTIQRLSKQLKQQNQQLLQEVEYRRRAEAEAAAASLAKSEFLANMSHELRTPLNAILGFSQLMNRNPLLTAEQQHYLRIINRNGEHLLQLINDVLQISKIEAGIISLDTRNFDVYRLFDNLEETFQFKAELKKIHLKFIIEPDVPQYMKNDENKLRSCLNNLLDNAIKFTDYGSVTLRVMPDREEYSSPRLWFEVEDTGKGIAPVEIDKLFDAFVQTEIGKKSAEGTGLGLTITRKFVQLMGGDITVESVIGEGTLFKFYIQLVPADTLEITQQPRWQIISLAPGSPFFRILVVDDTTDSRLLLVKLLQPIGFEVREAENGQQAISVWQNWQPHLILMDTRMPVMNGIDATKEIRAREQGAGSGFPSNLSSIPHKTVIIALTASTFEERKGEILAAGTDDFLRKPFDEQVLLDKMAEYLGVSYIYEKFTQSSSISVENKYYAGASAEYLILEELATMPSEWVQQLYEAANEVNEDFVADLIAEIPENHTALSKALQNLINDFRLDIIVRLTESFLKKF